MVTFLPDLFRSNLEVNPAELAQLAFAAQEEMTLQKRIVKAREYHEGASFDTELVTKLEQFVIGGDVKGAVIGAGAGAAAGTGVALATKEHEAYLSSGTVVRLVLDEPLVVAPRPVADDQ